MNYCGHCGSDQLHTFFSDRTLTQALGYRCLRCRHTHYVRLQVVVCAVAVHDGKVLLGRRAQGAAAGTWNIPAGFLEPGEAAPDGALRELREETYATGQVERLLTLYSLPDRQQLDVHFLVHLANDRFSPSAEASEVRLFSPDEIPWDELSFRSCTFALRHYLRNPTAVDVRTFSEE